MLYEVNFNGKTASVAFDDGLSSAELDIVTDTLLKCLERQKNLVKKKEGTTLDINDSFMDMFPPLTGRTANVLRRAGKKTIKDVLDCTPTELTQIRNMGKKSLEEIAERFSKYGKFKEEVREE